jgi:polyisoprenoid-binding protein YceI
VKSCRIRLVAVWVAAGWTFLPGPVQAALWWHNAPAPARLGFLAHWESSAINGRFPVFRCLLETTSSDQPQALKVVIRTASLRFRSPLLERPARSAVWFDVKAFPQAVFSSHEIQPLGPGQYHAAGVLVLKGVRHEVSVRFHLTSPRPGFLLMTGTGQVRRQVFGIGNGVWQKSSMVGSRVVIHFRVGFVPGP